MLPGLDEQIAQHGLASCRDAIIESLRPAIRAIPRLDKPAQDDGSRYGGRPLVEQGFEWPHGYDGPLTFMAQINCAEIPRLPGITLPEAGLLQFFFAADVNARGEVGYSGDDGFVRHLALEDAAGLAELEEEAPEIPVMAALDFECIRSLPTNFTDEYEQLHIPDESSDAYDDLLRTSGSLAPDGENHQLLGHPYNLQNDMKFECALKAAGMDYGFPDWQNYREELTTAAADWRLLFQMDSDPKLNFVFGDVGLVCFWIKQQDLLAGDFTNTQTIVQCG
jgi:uncharacterized protein YwqG